MTEEQAAAEAKELLADVERVRSQARTSLLSANYALFLLWGLLTIGSTVPLLAGAPNVGNYWVGAAPVGALISFWLGFRSSEAIGTGESSTPYVITAVGIFVFTFGGSALFDGGTAIVWVFASLAVGFGVFAFLDRQLLVLPLLALVVAMIIALGITIEDTAALYLSCAFLLGGGFLGLGTGLWITRS